MYKVHAFGSNEYGVDSLQLDLDFDIVVRVPSLMHTR
jgi:hypothetical protein